VFDGTLVSEMRIMFKLYLSVLVAILFVPSIALGQLQGDECGYPIIATEGANSFDTTFATPSTPEPDDTMCAGTFLNWNSSQDVWFKFNPTTTGLYTFTTCDTNSYDTSMALYEGDCSTQVACNGDGSADNGCQSYYSYITHSLAAGIPYYIRIGGYQGAIGNGTLTIDPPASGGVTIWYVDMNNPTPGSGTDWSSAFLTVQDALDFANGTDQVWIAQGTYTPTDTNGSSDLRDASFRLRSNIELYGGFQGNELNLSQRQPTVHRVFLSGDLYGDDTGDASTDENSYHVVFVDGSVATSPLLDGLYIASGNANSSGLDKYGAGLVIGGYSNGSTSFPLVHGCRFIKNSASVGGAISILSVDDGLSVDRCIFANNKALLIGGAVHNGGSATITNSLFAANNANTSGGAISCDVSSSTTINNSTVAQNRAAFVGGLYNSGSTTTLTNTIFWGNTDVFGSNAQVHDVIGTLSGNYNCIENLDSGFSGVGNISVNPIFVNEFGVDGTPGTGDEIFELLQQSPCIDVGDNSVVSRLLDLIGNSRIIDDPYTFDGNGLVVDLGAYEHVPESNGVSIWTGANSSFLTDPYNWLPTGAPDFSSTLLFNTTGSITASADQALAIEGLSVLGGDVNLNLDGTTLTLYSESDPIRVGGVDLNASLYVWAGAGGAIQTYARVELLESDVYFDNELVLYAPDVLIDSGTILAFSGVMDCTLTNIGSSVQPGANTIGTFMINGDLVHSKSEINGGSLLGSLNFDIKGVNPVTDVDKLEVTGNADMSCTIALDWSRAFTPINGDAFDLMSVGTSSSNPILVYSDGLPSDLAIRWITPTALRVGEEVLVETTGPILFETNETHALTSQTPNEIVVADLDGDGDLDVAIAVPNAGGANGNVIVLQNDGTSGAVWQGFTELTPITVEQNPIDIAIADFNGDGTRDDLVVANYDSNSVSVLTNDGSGTFTTSHVALNSDTGPKYIAVANYIENGDLLEDIAVACDSFDISILENTTTFRATSFAHTSSIGIPQPGDILPGDVNNDKGSHIDYVVLNIAGDSVQVYDGDGAGTFPPFSSADSSPLPASSDPAEFSFADLDGDGDDDLITVNEGNSTMSVLLDIGTGFGSTASVSVGLSPQEITVADFDNDLDPDLVISAIGSISGSRELTVIRNDTATVGGTVVLAAGDATASGSEPVLIQSGDIDGDGLVDLISVVDLAPVRGRANSPAIGVYFNTTAVVSNCPEDLDGDGSIAIGDILALISAWGTVNEAYDLDGSGVVDIGDILIIVSAWGACP